jgi:hypothetical protein
MELLTVFLLFFLFQAKHLIMDFFVQSRFPYMWLNKGKLLHPGGWLHAGTNALGSFGVFALVHPPTVFSAPWWSVAAIICEAEFFIHFFIDLCKVRLNEKAGWKCNTSPYFWDLLGVDQFLHQMTYLFMIYIWVT